MNTEMRWWTGLRWALVLIVVALMLVLAAALGTHAIIFPEGAALAMGIWVLRIPGWSASRWRVAVLPPLCALVGVLLARSDQPAWAAMLAATAVALLVLQACDSRLAPAVSAAVLPVVFDVRAWSYPVAVLVICAVVAAGMPWFGRRGDAPLHRGAKDSGRYPWSIVGAGAAVIAAWVLAGCLAVVVTLALMRATATAHPPALAIALIPQILQPSARDPLDYTLAIAAGAGALYLATYATAAVLARREGVASETT